MDAIPKNGNNTLVQLPLWKLTRVVSIFGLTDGMFKWQQTSHFAAFKKQYSEIKLLSFSLSKDSLEYLAIVTGIYWFGKYLCNGLNVNE